MGDSIMPSKELPLVMNDGVVVLEHHQILDTSWVKQGNKFEADSLL